MNCQFDENCVFLSVLSKKILVKVESLFSLFLGSKGSFSERVFVLFESGCSLDAGVFLHERFG